MASHLTITAKAPAGAPTTKGFNPQGGSDADNGVMGQFAAMLSGTQPSTSAKATAEAKVESGLSQLARLLSGGTEADTADKDPKDPEAIAAAINTTLPITAQIDIKAALTGLVNDLATLKKGLAAGEAVDPALLKRIDAALDGLGDTFKIDLSAAGGLSIADLTALVQSVADGDQGTTAQLTKALAPVTQTLLAGDVAVAPDADTEITPLIKTIGDKLANLLQALNKTDATDADNVLATSGKTQTAADADLNAAIAKLQSLSGKPDPGATAPVLDKPKLTLTEPILTGKSADAAASSATASTDKTDGLQPPAMVGADAKSDNGTGSSSNGDAKAKSDDKKPADANAAAAPTASVADARNDAQGTTQNTVQAARVDAAAPRVVQAGYQTSQQQLNLPQLAFELVRQVNDGNTRFQMRLDPPELGRIDVKLDIDKTGQINARLIVDKSETLDLMQRDQRALERALQQAGLDSSKTNLEFSLKQSPFSGGQQQGRNDQAQPFNLNGVQAGDLEEAPPTINLYRASLSASGVNIIA
ncbi:MAG: flagellar hook-length control protein FliK [Devosia sp.]